MSKNLPITRQQLLDPEGAYIQQLLSLARNVLAKAMRRNNVQAARIILEHYEPKPILHATVNGPVVIRWDLSAPEILPVSARTGLKSTSSDGSNGSPSLCVIEDGERPPSA